MADPDLLTLERFGSLRLDVDPLEVGVAGAQMCDDVRLPQGDGSLRPRHGRRLVHDTAGVDVLSAWKLSETTVGVWYVSSGMRFGCITLTGGVATLASSVATSILNTGQRGRGVRTRLQATEEDVVYGIAGGTTYTKLVGTTTTVVTPSGLPGILGIFQDLCMTPSSDRLCIVSSSKVWFSDPGDHATFDSSNYVSPVGGSGIYESCVSWGDYVFVFRRDAFFVFYGESTDSTGGPVFNYRTIGGVGAHGNCVAGPDGVYFRNDRGVWRTTGGQPQLISQEISPLFEGRDTAHYTAEDFADANVGLYFKNPLSISRDHLYVQVGDQTFVRNLRTGAWSALRAVGGTDPIGQVLPVTDELTGSEAGELEVVPSTGQLYLRSVANSDDIADLAGTSTSAVPFYWCSGIVTPAPARRVTARDLLVNGDGLVNAKILTDYEEPAAPYVGVAMTGAGHGDCSVSGERLSFYVENAGSATTELRRMRTLVTSAGPLGNGLLG